MELQLIIKQCKSHSRRAQSMFYNMFSGKMFMLCRRIIRNDEVAEEMAMNGFLKFFKSIKSFTYENEKSTKIWLRTIMVHECVRYLKSNIPVDFDLENLDEIEMPHAAINRIDSHELYRLIDELPVGCREAFNLGVVEEIKYYDVSLLLGISVGTVKSQVNRAKQLLKERILKNAKNDKSYS